MGVEPPFARVRTAWHRIRSEALGPLGPIESRCITDLFGSVRLYGTMIVALLVLGALVARPYLPGWAVPGFLALLLLEGFVKLYLPTRYARAADPGPPPGIWRTVVMVGTLYSGVLYGTVSLVVFLPMPDPTRLVLVAIYATLLTWGIWGMPQYMRVSVCLAVPMAVPMATALLLGTSTESRLLGALILLVTAIGLSVNRGTGSGLVRLIELDIENRQLLERLEREKAVADGERERAEQAVIDKSLFIATASHDLRQPVHALGLFQHALAARCEEPGDAVLIGAIGESSAALMALLDGLLDVSRLDARAIDPDWQSFGLDTLLAPLRREFAPSVAAAGLNLRIDGTRCTVFSDPQLLGRVLRNLLSNAVKFSRGGTITLDVQDALAIDGTDTVRVRVRDEGPGIAPHDIERVFAEFYRGDSGQPDRSHGSGLGLSIVARLCSLLDIALSLESDTERGTTVRLDIRRAADTVPAPVRPGARPESGRRFDGLRVLVIDDDPAIRAGMREALEQRGCSVTVADGMEGAIAGLGSGPPDVLLCDYRVGAGPDGVAIVQALRRQAGCALPAAIISGEPLGRPSGHGMDSDIELLRKPVSLAVLYETLHRLANGRPADGPPGR